MKQYLLIGFICLFTGICLANPTAQLPSNAAVVIRWDGSSFEESDSNWKNPELQEACAMFREIVQSLMSKAPENPLVGTGYDFEDYLELAKTKITLALVFEDGSDQDPSSLIIFEDGKKVESRIRSLFIKLGNYTGRSFKMKGIIGEELTPQSGSEVFFTALWNGYYILSPEKKDALEKFIQGEKNTPDANFQTLSKMTDSGGSTIFSVYVNLQKIWQDVSENTAKELENFGLKNWQGVMLQVQKGDTCQTKFALLAPGEKEGLTEILSLSGGSLPKLQKHLPFEVSHLEGLHLDVQKIMHQVMAMAQKNDSKEYLRMQKDLEEFRQTGWDLDKEILGVFSGDILLASPDYKYEALRGSSFLLLGLRDPKQFRVSLDRLLAMGFVEKKEITHHGKTIEYYMSPLQNLMQRIMQGADNFEPSPASIAQLGLNYYLGLNLCFVVDGDVVVASSLVQNLKDYIDYRHENPDFALKHPSISAQTGIMSWGGNADSSLYFYNTLLPILSFCESAIREAGVPFKMSRMPSASALKSLFGPSSILWENHENGISVSFQGCSLSISGSSLIAFTGIGVAAALLIPAMSEVQMKAKEIKAVNSLRLLSTAQEQFRVMGTIDQDEDGIGEYGFIQELTFQSKERFFSDSGFPFLAESFYVNEMGIAENDGYCFKLYFPAEGGGIGESWPLPSLSQSEDDINRRETGYIIYAWPKDYGNSGERVFVMNSSGDMFACTNEQMYSGYDNIPNGAAALDKTSEGFDTLEAPFSDSGESGDGEDWSPTY